MELLCDYREKKCIEIFKKFGTNFETENLELGDFHICDSFKKPLIIIERKTISDLYSSIKDGRYNEQGKRLQVYKNTQNIIVLYIIEDDYKLHDFNLMYSCMYSLQIKKGFWCWRSKNQMETCKIILQIIKKINKDGIHEFKKLTNQNGGFSQLQTQKNNTQTNLKTTENIENNIKSNTEDIQTNNQSSENMKVNYNDCVIKTKKNENITIQNIGVFMLSQIPYISFKQAEVIMNYFKTFEKLIQFLKNNKDNVNKIDDFVRLENNRKISKRVKENLYKFLLINE